MAKSKKRPPPIALVELVRLQFQRENEQFYAEEIAKVEADLDTIRRERQQSGDNAKIPQSKTTKAAQKKAHSKRRKTPPQLLKESRERQAAQELVKNPNITADKLGKILACDKSTVVRLKAWQNKGVLSHPAPSKGFKKRAKDDDKVDIEAIDKSQ
jgi:hypothetical protein